MALPGILMVAAIDRGNDTAIAQSLLGCASGLCGQLCCPARLAQHGAGRREARRVVPRERGSVRRLVVGGCGLGAGD
jgi:hypothetical protein